MSLEVTHHIHPEDILAALNANQASLATALSASLASDQHRSHYQTDALREEMVKNSGTIRDISDQLATHLCRPAPTSRLSTDISATTQPSHP